MAYFIGHDLGTGGNKAVLLDEEGTVRSIAMADYPLDHPHPGWAEQDPERWWEAVCRCTREVVRDAGVPATDIAGIAFAGQMLSLVPLDSNGRPTRRAISWLDGRAGDEARALTRRLGGATVVRWLAGASPTGKDIVAKVRWMARHEPRELARTAALCDATGYLVARATGRLLMDPTAAGATGMFLAGSRRWSRLLSAACGFPLDKTAKVVPSTAVAGPLREDAAAECGLAPGTPVAMGMADIPAAAVGSGAVRPGDGHVYLGTSAWIGVTVRRPLSVGRAGIASVPSAGRRHALAIGESETAGACRDWLLRELGAQKDATSFDRLASRASPGADGLLFVPWMYGERSPVPDAEVRGAFVNLSLQHTRAHMMRAVYEGVALNLRWIVDEMASAGERCPTLRAIGGGAASDLWLQVLADATGRPIERVAEPRAAGAVGAALVAAVAAGALPDLATSRDRVRVERRFEPDPDHAVRYDRALEVLRALHAPLSQAGRRLGER